MVARPAEPAASCHGLLLETASGLALVDAGIGLLDYRDSVGWVGPEAIAAAGFQFRDEDTAARQFERLGLAKCRERGHRVAVVFGHANDYPRFGSSAALAERRCSSFPGPHFKALKLVPGR